jgi:hypothetical protein
MLPGMPACCERFTFLINHQIGAVDIGHGTLPLNLLRCHTARRSKPERKGPHINKADHSERRHAQFQCSDHEVAKNPKEDPI